MSRVVVSPAHALVLLCMLGMWSNASLAADSVPLHDQIDALIAAQAKWPVAPQSSDGEFLRRVYLDLAGRIPALEETRAFLADTSSDKRTVLIDRLLASED